MDKIEERVYWGSISSTDPKECVKFKTKTDMDDFKAEIYTLCAKYREKREQNMSMFGDFEKVKNVIGSCKTYSHLEAANNLVKLYKKMYMNEKSTSTACLLVDELQMLYKRKYSYLD
jgi:hypothetical protein